MMSLSIFTTQHKDSCMTQTDAEADLRVKVAQRIVDMASARGLDGRSLAAYVEHGQEPSGFLRALLEDSLLQAAGKADDLNAHKLYDWAVILYSAVPATARGSSYAVVRWLAHRGMAGLSGRD
jgi:hypothetical protein